MSAVSICTGAYACGVYLLGKSFASTNESIIHSMHNNLLEIPMNLEILKINVRSSHLSNFGYYIDFECKKCDKFEGQCYRCQIRKNRVAKCNECIKTGDCPLIVKTVCEYTNPNVTHCVTNEFQYFEQLQQGLQMVIKELDGRTDKIYVWKDTFTKYENEKIEYIVKKH